ncbi:unnamed protein product, partial (macronuclear) [Paramecium tetraurelia]
MLSQTSQTEFILRGGGCGSWKTSPLETSFLKSDNQELYNFFNKFNFYVEKICTKAIVAADQLESQEIMIALQWFIFQEESIYKLNKNAQGVVKSYDLILEGVRRLLKSCLFYIKTDSFKCLYILQTTASLSKVIFSFHLLNGERFMKYDLQKEFLDISDELRQHMEIEKNDLIQNQMELYLFLTKTSFEMAPNNSNEREEILKGCLSGIIGSIIQMKPNEELLESLFQGVCHLYKLYVVNNNRNQFEVYFQIDMLQWEIINYFKNEKWQTLDQIICQVEEIHSKIVKNSNVWKFHYLWVQMIGKIILYNPILTKKKLSQLINDFNFGLKSDQIWKDYHRKGLIIQMNYSNDQAIIQLNKLQDNQLSQIDTTIFESCFKEWEIFLLLKDVLMNEQQQNFPFSLGSYLKCKLEIGEEFQRNEDILAINNIQSFLGFLISNQLLTLIKQNDEKLEEVIKMCRNIRNDKQYNESVTLQVSKQQIKRIIHKLQDYFQNTQTIIKIMRLNQSVSKNRNEHKDIQKLKNLFRLQEVLQLYIILNQRNPQNKKFTDDNGVIQEWICLISEELTTIDLKEYKLPFLDASATQQSRNQILVHVEKLIEILQKDIYKLEIKQIQNNLLQYFQSLVNNLYLYYENVSSELSQNQLEFNLCLKEIMIIMYQIETVPQIFDLKKIKKALDDMHLLKFLDNLRCSNMRLKLKLVNSRKSFSIILEKAKLDELRKLLEVIHLDQFLLNLIQDFPKRIMRENTKFDTLFLSELQNINIKEEDFANRLSKQKGIIKYLIFKYSIKAKMFDSESKDLELIEKEFGEQFIKEIPSQFSTEKIKKIFEDLQVDESLKNVREVKFNLLDLRLEKEKYKDLGKCQLIENWNSIVMQIETVIKTIETFGQTDKEIGKMLINEELMNLKIMISQNKITLKELQVQVSEEQLRQEGVLNKNSNLTDQFQLNSQLEGQSENDKICELKQNGKKFNFRSDNNYRTYLSFMIKIIKLKKLKLQEEMELLQKLLEEFVLFSVKLDQIEKYKIEIQIKFQQRFQCYIQEFIQKFELLQLTDVNLYQKEDESFHLYLDRIETELFKRIKDKEIIQTYINIPDFLNQLEIYVYEKVVSQRCFANSPIKQDFLIKQIKKIYLEDLEEVEADEESNQQFGLEDNLIQKYQDFINNDQWKIKQGLVFTIIQISSNSYSDNVTSFCQKVLIKMWIQEKDLRVRNILKHKHLISLQMQIMQKDWSTQIERIAKKMQEMLSRIDELQEQISHEANLKKRDLDLKELDETTEKIDQQIENISEMGQQLNLITDFVNHIRKGLIRVEGKINEMKEQLKSIEENLLNNYLKLENGKYQKTLHIRTLNPFTYHYKPKRYIIKQSQGKRKMIKLKQINDTEGEVNEFLLEEKETVLLIHGVAGSGKSTTAKKIEEFIWKLHDNNKKIRNQVLIPVYISLPSLKNPVFQAVEEALHQDEYGFDELQLKECKEILEGKEFRLLLIMDSYDEMRLEMIQKNLYINNKLKQNWFDPLVIFTTRSEIFTSSNYAFWFAPDNKENIKEIQLQKFNPDQTMEYLKKFTIQSVKMLIFEIYEWQTQILNRGVLDINNFEISWEELQEQCLNLEVTNFNGEALLNQKQIENILSFLKNNYFFSFKSNEALRSLSVKLQKLWSVEKYEKMMKHINLHRLVETPYMMEIIVQVLPKMMVKASEIINLRLNFLKNFPNMLHEFYKSNYLIRLYNWQQKQHLAQYETESEVTSTDVENLEKINYFEIALGVWNKMEENSIAIQFFSHQELNDLNKILFNLFEHNFELFNNAFAKIYIQKDRIIEVVSKALYELNLSNYDFYNEFINQYHYQQIEKQRNMGKSIHIDRFLHDLKKYSTNLAKVMSRKQMTQVEFQQYGFLYQEEREEEKWQNEFFNDDDRQFGSYQKDLRSCSLIKQKGTNFQFAHKSIQEFYIAADIYDILVLSKDFNEQIFNWMLEQLSKENNYDKNCIEYLSNQINQENLIKVDVFKTKIQLTLNLLRTLKKHEFFLENYSTSTYAETRKYLNQKINKERLIIEFLKFLVYLTAVDKSFIQGGSNSLNILVEMQVDLTNLNFEKIRIKNTSIEGGNFAKCNLSRSEFTDVNINEINLNGAQMFNCKWYNLIINDLYSFYGHQASVETVGFSSDGTTLASGSRDNSIRLWDAKTGKQKAKLDGHSDGILSINFSPDGTTLASGSQDKSIRLWDVKTGKQKAKLDGHSGYVYSVNFSDDGNILEYGSEDMYMDLWEFQKGQQKGRFDCYQSYIYQINLYDDGKKLEYGSKDKQISLGDVKKGKQKKIIDVNLYNDGNKLEYGSDDKCISLWDVKKRQQKAKLDGHEYGILSVHFSPDGTTLASGSGDNSIRLWDVKTGQQKAKLDGHSSFINSVNFSPDGTTLASGSEDNSIRLWDVKTGQQKAKLDGHEYGILSVNFSPDGTTLASGSGDNSIRLWDVKTGQQKAKLDGHSNTVYSVNFSPDVMITLSVYGILRQDIQF